MHLSYRSLVQNFYLSLVRYPESSAMHDDEDWEPPSSEAEGSNCESESRGGVLEQNPNTSIGSRYMP